MKIAYLTNQYPMISHTFIRREIEALEAFGVEVSRFSVRPTPDDLIDDADRAELDRTHTILADGLRPLLAAAAQVSVRHPVAFARAAARAAALSARAERGPLVHGIYLLEACRLFLWLREAKVDHLHVHFGTNPTTVAMLCKELGGPRFSFTAHGPEEFDKPNWIRLPDKIASAAFVVGISAFGRAQLLRHCSYADWSKVRIVRCGLDASFTAREPTPVPAAARLAFIGRLDEQKAPNLLVEAAAQLKRRGLQFELVMLGDGPLRPHIEAQIADCGLGDHVKLEGWASGHTVQGWLEKSRALVLPSFAEGLPVVIMEALAMGRPVISTYVAGIPELVVPGETGWLVPAGAVDELASAMAAALTGSVSDLSTLGRRGRERVLRDHDISTNARQLLASITRACLLPPSAPVVDPSAGPSSEPTLPANSEAQPDPLLPRVPVTLETPS